MLLTNEIQYPLTAQATLLALKLETPRWPYDVYQKCSYAFISYSLPSFVPGYADEDLTFFNMLRIYGMAVWTPFEADELKWYY